LFVPGSSFTDFYELLLLWKAKLQMMDAVYFQEKKGHEGR